MGNKWFVLLCIAGTLWAAVEADGAMRARRIATTQTVSVETPRDQASQITFTGKVLDGQGQPIPEVKLSLYQMTYDMSVGQQKAELVEEKNTDADGVFSFTAAKDTQTYREGCIIARKEGLALGWAVWRMRESQQSDITLGEPKELGGAVVDENGGPVAEAEVSIALAIIGKEQDRRYMTAVIAPELLTVTTDSNGRFVFSSMPAEATFEFFAKKPGRASICTFDSSTYRGEKCQFSPGQAGIKVVLPPEAQIKGTIVEKAGGKPVGGLKVTAQSDQRGLAVPTEPIISAEDGTFCIGSLAAGNYAVQLAPTPERIAEWVTDPVSVSLKAGETRDDVKLLLAKGGIIEVLVKETNGKPVAKAGVSVRHVEQDRWLSSQTDENGLARLRVTPGQYNISGAHKQGYAGRRNAEDVLVEEGQTKRVEWTIAPAPKIAGTVRDPDGNALAGVKLEVKPSGGGEVTTNADGKFEADWDPDSWGGPEGTTFVLVARDVERNLAATIDLDEQNSKLDLKLVPGMVFTGKVLNHEGKPLADARVRVMLRVSNWGSSLGRGEQATTGPDGTFEVKAIPPERQYIVTALAEGYGKSDVTVDAFDLKKERHDLGEFKLPLADLSISGVVVDVNDQPVPDADIYGYGENQPDSLNIKTDEQGKFVVKNVCAGSIRLSVNVRGASRLYGYTTSEGGATDVKVVVSERPSGQRYVPRKPPALAGKPLPDLKAVGIELPADANDRMLLVCLWDMNQRPSRHCVAQLAQQAAALAEKSVTVVAVQAAQIEDNILSQWIEKSKVPFPVGRMPGNAEKTRFDWGAASLPHLILTDKKHVVATEGFDLGELDKKIEEAAGR